MDEDLKKELALKQAKIAINFGVTGLIFCFLLLIQNQYFPNIFSASNNIEAIDSTQNDLDPSSMFELDSTSIKDGIHIPTGLIVDDGVYEVMTTCGACHSIDLVTQNRASRQGWKDIIVWMQETQKLWDLGEKEVIILDYLAKNYAPENTGRRKGLEDVEWYNL